MCEILTNNKLDQLFENIELDQPDSGNDNNKNNDEPFQVVLFASAPTVEPQGLASPALTEECHKVRWPEGGPDQRLSLSVITKEIPK